VDVGAFDGDTLREFLKRISGKFLKYIALEPDKINFDKFLKAIPKKYKHKIIPLCAGAGDKNQTVNFHATGGLDSLVGEEGDEKIKVFKLDDICSGETVTMIKMDVEGYEPKVIAGMKDIVKKSKPKLAICLYHRPDHLWEIPLMISKINAQYKNNFYIRHHQEGLFETVLYCY
jgi:FkbM family methyltransferase